MFDNMIIVLSKNDIRSRGVVIMFDCGRTQSVSAMVPVCQNDHVVL